MILAECLFADDGACGRLDAATALACLAFYIYQLHWRQKCGWEVIFVAAITALVSILSIAFPEDVPVTLHVRETDERMPWLRYVGWLLTCPVLLIQLSNPASDKVFNVKRMMRMVVSVQFMLLAGATGAMMETVGKWIFFFIGCVFILFGIFFAANEIHGEAHALDEVAKFYFNLYMYIFYFTWTLYGVLFIFEPTGIDLIGPFESEVAYSVLDMLSKQTFGFVGWYLRWEVLRVRPHSFCPFGSRKKSGIIIVL